MVIITVFFFNDTATTEIYTLSLHTLFRSPGTAPTACLAAAPAARPSIAYTCTYPRDRKSTRLNSSHSQISYAVFCLREELDVIVVVSPHLLSELFHIAAMAL